MSSAKILLFTHKKLNDGSNPIVLQIIKDRKRKLISLGHSATSLQWDKVQKPDNLTTFSRTKLTTSKLLFS